MQDKYRIQKIERRARKSLQNWRKIMNKEQLYKEREKRVNDAIGLKVPDRVPLAVSLGFFAAKYAGYTNQEVMYDPDKLWDAQWKTTFDFPQDLERDPFGLTLLGPTLDRIGFRQLRWAGGGLPPDAAYQFVEGEYMKPDEYDHFLLDPSDFIVRTYLPRICDKLTGLSKLPSLHSIISYSMGLPFGLAPFNDPEVQQALEVLKQAGSDAVTVASYSRRFREKAKEEGFPVQWGGFTQAPFDTLGDYFRGTKGIMLDMYRRPDKLIKACEKLLPLMVETAHNGFKGSGNPRVFMPLHKGLDGFMSLEQFKRFFWPTLNELMTQMIDLGMIPCPFWEGDCTSRLDTIKDVPPGKVLYKFESTDLIKAKQILGDRVCIRGGMPISALITGTPDDIKTHCQTIIKTIGKDGGFIMDASTGLDDVSPENVKAFFQYTREYGVY
jgi:uroporphyrinogen-III decarboxylase